MDTAARGEGSARRWPIAIVAMAALGLDVLVARPWSSVIVTLAMATWLGRLARDLLHRDPVSQRWRMTAVDGTILGALVLLFATRAYVAALQFGDLEDVASLSSAVRTYDVVFAVVGSVCTASSAMPDRVARLALSLTQRPARLLSGSFAAMIALGTLLLMLPVSVTEVREVSFVDALFTITSAVCVTGLTVNDVGETYSRFGQIVILLSIQFGGIGIMTVAALALTFSRSGPLATQLRYASMMDARTLADLRFTVRSIVFGTFAIEAIGATALWWMLRDDPLAEGESPVFLGIFHAVSAFCNAGFALFPNNLMSFADRELFQLVVMGLIVAGGLGFPVIAELVSAVGQRLRKWVLRRSPAPRRMSLTSRVVLATTFLLIVSGWLVFVAFEFTGPAMAELHFGHRLLAALFASVNTRTSGFNTIDLGAVSTATLLLTCVWMFVGGSPGSTAGGIKTTTLAAIFASLRGELTGEETRLFDRAIAPEVFRKAIAVASISAGVVLVSLVLVTLTEADRGFRLEQLLFEVVSAFATVGLSTGITAKLSVAAKLVIAGTMFVGRIGPLTLALALASRPLRAPYRLARETLAIG